MATKPLKTLTFEGLSDTYTVPQIDASLSTAGKAADAKATGDSLAEKVSASGMVDMAKSLVGGKYTSDKQPYHFRKSFSGGAKDEVIVGGSLGWNQLADKSVFPATTTTQGITYTNNGDGSISVSGTASAIAPLRLFDISTLANHVYLLIGCPSGGGNGNYALYANKLSVQLFDSGAGDIKKMSADAVGDFYFIVYSEKTVNFKFVPQLIDLTACFGSTIADYIYSLETATAGAGVAWVKRYIDLDTYHEYDAGSIQSVEGLVSHDVVGFNQWDEETANGYWNDDGTANSSSDYIRCKNKIRVVPGASYYLKAPTTAGNVFTKFYDVNGANALSPTIAKNTVFTIPDGYHYFAFAFAKSAYGTTYNHDICINLSDPSRNGQYEPYEKHSYPLDSSITLRGIPKLVTDHIEFDGDRFHADGSVERRYGVVDLGTLNYSKNTSVAGVDRYACSPPGIKAGTSASVANAICATYPVTSISDANTGETNVFAVYNQNVWFYTATWTYADAEAFKTAMSGVYLVYELATPTTETAQPFQSPMIVGATEEYISDSVVPVGHESKYYEDVAKKVSGLPKDFSTLIAPVEVTFTATRNYSVGSYLIVKNQLYKVTSAISSGGTITPNSNVTATTIMAEILALA